MPASGTSLPYEQLETERFIGKHGITSYTFNPFFPVNTLALMRGAIAAQRIGVFDALRRPDVPPHVGPAEKDGRPGSRCARRCRSPVWMRRS